MKLNECVPQRISKLMFASLLMLAGVVLIIIGITLVPIIGFVLAVPVIGLAIYVFKLHLNEKCEIDMSSK